MERWWDEEDQLVDGWMGGWVDGWWIVERMDGQMDGLLKVCKYHLT